MGKRNITPERLSRIQALRASGLTFKAIAQLETISAPAVYYILHPERRSFGKDDPRTKKDNLE